MYDAGTVQEAGKLELAPLPSGTEGEKDLGDNAGVRIAAEFPQRTHDI